MTTRRSKGKTVGVWVSSEDLKAIKKVQKEKDFPSLSHTVRFLLMPQLRNYRKEETRKSEKEKISQPTEKKEIEWMRIR